MREPVTSTRSAAGARPADVLTGVRAHAASASGRASSGARVDWRIATNIARAGARRRPVAAVWDAVRVRNPLARPRRRGHNPIRGGEHECQKILALLTAATSARDCFLATVLDTVASLVLVLDPEGRIVLFNRECERVSGYGAAEVLGRHVFDVVIAPEDAEKVKGVFRRLRAGESNAYDNVWVRKDGTRREIAWSNTILGDADGKVLYVVPTGVDVTERRAAERRAKESEEQLAQAAKLEAIGRLAGGVAHDFNNLLVVILAQAGALKEAVSPPLRADVEEIEQAGRQAAALTHQLLAFGRRRVVCHAPLDVNATIPRTRSRCSGASSARRSRSSRASRPTSGRSSPTRAGSSRCS